MDHTMFDKLITISMGTHCLIKFRSIHKQNITEYMVVYFQYDGYPLGVPYDLIKFIQSKIAKCPYYSFESILTAYIKESNACIYPINYPMNEEWNYVLTYNTETKDYMINVNDGPDSEINEFKEKYEKIMEEDTIKDTINCNDEDNQSESNSDIENKHQNNHSKSDSDSDSDSVSDSNSDDENEEKMRINIYF